MGIIEYIGSIGGTAGVLAVLIFIAYKYLNAQMRQDRKYMEDRLTEVIKDYNGSARANTTALTELITWLKAKNGH